MLTDHQIGCRIIDAISKGPLVKVECPNAPNEGCLSVWSESSAEQIGAMARGLVLMPESTGEEPRKDGIARPDRKTLHMATAFLWSLRSLDPRRQVGAVITTEDMRRVLSVGYNGPAKGLPHTYVRDTPGDSGCLHAEDNAIAYVDSTIPNKILFVTDQPCEMCSQRIINAGFKRVHYVRQYRDARGLSILRQCGIELDQMQFDAQNLASIFMLLHTQSET